MARKGFEVEGLREFQRAVRKSTDRELPKRLGQANKRVGQLVISRLQPRPARIAVGAGKGATPRASASKRDVILRVGGAHRSGHAPEKQWGRQVVQPFRHAPKRPHIIGTARRHEREIVDLYLAGIAEAVDPAFYKADL